jgi:hypothetical protein
MLAATRLLIADGTPYALRSLACSAVAAGGGPDDLAVLLDRALVAPDDLLCWSLMALGTRDTGERLLQAFVTNNQLRDGAPETLLHALGHLGVDDAEPVLWAAAHVRDHYVHQAACLGLVDLARPGRESAVADAIRACHGHNLFGEFWPALAGQVGDPELLDPFIAAGAPTSTDCFGGVLLGLALLGARATFESVLFDPFWEATDTGTDNRRWCGLAVRILGLSLCDLRRARDALTPDDIATFAALVHLHATRSAFPRLRAARPPADDDLAVYTEFFVRPHALDDLARRGDCEHAVRLLAESEAALVERLVLHFRTPEPNSPRFSLA